MTVFGGKTLNTYLGNLDPAAQADLSRLLRVPDDLTYAVAERASINWDRRDNPLGATKGTLVVGGVEHVHAYRPGHVATASVDRCPAVLHGRGLCRLGLPGG